MTARILFVDDNEDILDIFPDFIAKRVRGVEIVTARNGEEALFIVKNSLMAGIRRISLVISDVVMTGMSGLDLAAEIRRISADIPVVLLTAYDTAAVKKRAEALGIKEILSKTTGFDIIARRIETILKINA